MPPAPALRSFSAGAIGRVQVLDKPAIDLADTELDEVLGAGYGIFASREVQWATLRFSAERARWVAAESWHPRDSVGASSAYLHKSALAPRAAWGAECEAQSG